VSHRLVVDSLEALDDVLDQAVAARRRSDDAYREMLSSVLLDPRKLLGDLPGDPSSAEYRAAQLHFYERLTGHRYEVAHEETQFDRERLLRWPFPYITRSSATVGSSLMTYGQIIKEMALPSRSTVLEMGSGYGPLTYQMASMGYRVTCTDISEKLLEYVRTRCAGLPGHVETICCDLNTFSLVGAYDAVVFYESFHHVLDHAELLRRIDACLVDDGILVFAGEPIVPANSPIVPYPWGLRMDGSSLWAIRRDGWLELGFRIDYFERLLRDTGWSYRRIPSVSIPGMEIWICERDRKSRSRKDFASAELIRTWPPSDEGLYSECGRRDAGAGTLSSEGRAGYLLYGPYVALDAGVYEIVWRGTSATSVSHAVAEVVSEKGQDLLREVKVAASEGVLARARFQVHGRVADIEFRIRVAADDAITVTGLELHRLRGAA